MTRLFLAIAVLGVLAACNAENEQEPTNQQRTADNLAVCDPDNGGLKLPAGFCAQVVADNLGMVRHLDVTADGTIYVRSLGALPDQEPPTGGIVALRDADGDGRAEIQEWFGDHFGTGLEIRGNALYVSTDISVLRYRLTPGRLLPERDPEIIVEGFPERGEHRSKAFAFDETGGLYVNIGAPSNACQEQNRTGGSPGIRPCPSPGTAGRNLALRRRTRRSEPWSRRFPICHWHAEHQCHSVGPGQPGALCRAARARWPRRPVSTLFRRRNKCESTVGRIHASRRKCKLRLALLLSRQCPRWKNSGTGVWRRRSENRRVWAIRSTADGIPGPLGAERSGFLHRRSISTDLPQWRIHRVPRFVGTPTASPGWISGGLYSDGRGAADGKLPDLRGRLRRGDAGNGRPGCRSPVWPCGRRARSMSRMTPVAGSGGFGMWVAEPTRSKVGHHGWRPSPAGAVIC